MQQAAPLMSLPPASQQRRLEHRRQFDIQVFSRDDGLWEVDAVICDVRPQPTPLATGIRPAGHPVHDMLLRLVVDETLQIQDAGSQTRAMPYQGICTEHGDAYRRLIGLRLGRGFRRAAIERLGGVQGCTHLTELAQVLPTAVMQAMAGKVFDTRGAGDDKPFQIDGCHALRSDGEAVRLHYPRWYRKPVPATSASLSNKD